MKMCSLHLSYLLYLMVIKLAGLVLESDRLLCGTIWWHNSCLPTLLCSWPPVTLPLNVVSSSLVDIHTDPHAHILPAAGGKVQGEQFIRALTVRLQGALCLHQFTQQIGTTQSLLLHLPHASPLHVNNKPLRATWEKTVFGYFKKETSAQTAGETD